MIDVDELLVDPDFTQLVDIITSIETVNSGGLAVRTLKTDSGVVAIVQSNGGEKLIRLADGSRISDAINIWCRHSLHAATAKTAADIVVWEGQRYVVKVSNDWSQYGIGWFKATCEFLGTVPR
jgi:hypothetical protein